MGIVIYGIGASRLGRFGAFLGFPIMLISSVLTGNLLGAISGEWNGVGAKPKVTMTTGIALLVIAIAVLGYSASITP
jgi:hypothetical protein